MLVPDVFHQEMYNFEKCFPNIESQESIKTLTLKAGKHEDNAIVFSFP